MTSELATTQEQQIERRRAAGQAANKAASANVFNRYLSEKSVNTLDAQRADLATFAEYLCRFGAMACEGDNYIAMGKRLQTTPAAWHDMTWGLVDGFRAWLLQKGLAITTVNRKLSTVKAYAELATTAGVIDAQAGLLIRNIKGHGYKAGKNVDAERTAGGIVTRTSHKKAEAVELTPNQVRKLIRQPDTPQGRRDAVIMALLLDHGLRVGELAILEVTAFAMENGKPTGRFTFYRPKVGQWDTHELTPRAKRAVERWFATDAPAMGALLRSSRKAGKQKDAAGERRILSGGRLTNAGMSERAITERVRELGGAIGVHGLSAHDCRHTCLTIAARNGTDVAALRDMGGWTSPAMALRYVERAKIGNARVNLGDDGDD